MRWSDGSLQVLDLKAAVALSSTCARDRGWSHRVATHHARRSMHASCTFSRAPQRLRGRRQTDMNPSNPHVATLSDVARHRTRCTVTARRSDHNAEATEKAASADHRGRPAVLRQHSGHSRVLLAGTADEPWRAGACSGRKQYWGRGYCPFRRCADAYKVPKHVKRKNVTIRST